MIWLPWDKPVTLTRAWCLFELYCTVLTDSRLEVAMSNAAMDALFDSMGRLLAEDDDDEAAEA